MLTTNKTEYYPRNYYYYLANYISTKEKQDIRLNYIIILFLISLIVLLVGLYKPIFASNIPQKNKTIQIENSVYQQQNFEKYIRAKYPNSYVSFLGVGIAHIKKIKYINSKPVKINIVELNTNINPNIRIKPQISSYNLNSKTKIRNIAKKDNAIVAVNGGFFKPTTGSPLGALMIDGKMISSPIFNRVSLVIFEEDGRVSFKLEKVKFNIVAKTKKYEISIDNINQARMSKYHKNIYNSQWGDFSPIAPKNCYNLLIEDNLVKKVSANPILIKENQTVLQAPKDVIIKLINEKEVVITQSLAPELQKAKHIIGAGPYLVKDNKVYIDVKTQKLEAITGYNPRSAIGFDDKGNFIIVTIDGREKSSVGMSLTQEANLMKSLGCSQAMNLDGGSSSIMYVKGNVVNDAINKEGIAISNSLNVFEINPNQIQISSVQ